MWYGRVRGRRKRKRRRVKRKCDRLVRLICTALIVHYNSLLQFQTFLYFIERECYYIADTPGKPHIIMTISARNCACYECSVCVSAQIRF